MRPLKIVEHEDERIAAFARIGLQKALDDGAAHRANLLRVALDRPNERRILKTQVHQLTEKVGHVADLAVVEYSSELNAHPRLCRLRIHSLDDPETRAHNAAANLR